MMGWVVAATIIPVFLLSKLLQGWVLSILWGWFIIPVFDLPSIAVWEGAGIALVASYLTHQISSDDKPVEDTYPRAVVHGILGPPLMLFFGWIVHLFV